MKGVWFRIDALVPRDWKLVRRLVRLIALIGVSVLAFELSWNPPFFPELPESFSLTAVVALVLLTPVLITLLGIVAHKRRWLPNDFAMAVTLGGSLGALGVAGLLVFAYIISGKP